MTINQQLAAIRDALAPYAERIGAELAIAADRGDFLHRIQNNPAGMSIVLLFSGERMDEALANALGCWRTFSAILARPHGWTVQRAENLTEDRPEGAPFYNVLEYVRDAIVNTEFADEPQSLFWPQYKSTTLVDTGEAPMDAWEIVFECGARLGNPSDELEETL